MGLVRDQGVQIPGPFGETIVGPIDDKYIRTLATQVERKLAGPQPDPEPEIPREDAP